MYRAIKAIEKKLTAPVVLFQMGKVGSSSLQTTLTRYTNAPVYHAHSYGKMAPSQQRDVRWRRTLHLPVYVISPIREPIARNVSAFFQNFKRDTGLDLHQKNWSVAELTALFLDHCRHNVCLEWHDAHLRPTFGIDVFAEPFPVERKWQTYRHGSVRCLIYRADLDHACQLEVVSDFLGCRVAAWDYANRSADKEYANIYDAFVESAALPEVYIKLMYESRFARHFWSDAELRDFASAWRRA